jgi:two-component system response regulator RegX3
MKTHNVAAINCPEPPPARLRHFTPRRPVFASRSSDLPGQIIRFADVTVDAERMKIMRGGQLVKVTRTEYNLLLFFVQNIDRPLTRDVILDAAWGYDFYPNTRTVDVHVARLRNKLEPNPTEPRHFLTIHGVGYRFVA